MAGVSAPCSKRYCRRWSMRRSRHGSCSDAILELRCARDHPDRTQRTSCGGPPCAVVARRPRTARMGHLPHRGLAPDPHEPDSGSERRARPRPGTHRHLSSRRPQRARRHVSAADRLHQGSQSRGRHRRLGARSRPGHGDLLSGLRYAPGRALPSTLRAGLAAATLAVSCGAAADNLLDVYRLAVDSDPQLRQTEAAYRAVAETHDQARAQLLPQLSANAGIVCDRQEITESNSPFFPPSTFYATTEKYGLNLNQALYHRDYYARLKQADASTGQARAQYDAEQQNLVERVAQRYFNVLSASDDVVFARAEKYATGRLFEQNKQRFDVGLIAITDVHESQAAADLAAARAIAAETRLAVAEEELRELTGRSSVHLAAPQEEIPLVAPEPAEMQAWVDIAARQNLQLLAAQFAVTAAREEVELRRAGHYPTFDATASYGYNNVSAAVLGGSVTVDTTVGVQVNVPLYQGGGITARARGGGRRLTQSKEALEQQRRATDRQTRSAYLTVIDNINSVQALKQARLSNQPALEATEAGYEAGTRTWDLKDLEQINAWLR